MPLDSKPEDLPAVVRFSVSSNGGAFEVNCALLGLKQNPPYRIEGGAPRFHNRDAFKAKAVYTGLSPAVAEDQGRSFNATARQLRELGFEVNVIEKENVREEETE